MPPPLGTQKSDSQSTDTSSQMEVDDSQCEKSSVSQVDVDSGIENMEVEETDRKEAGDRHRVSCKSVISITLLSYRLSKLTLFLIHQYVYFSFIFSGCP